MAEIGVCTTEVASLDSGGVVDALSEWLGAHAPLSEAGGHGIHLQIIQ